MTDLKIDIIKENMEDKLLYSVKEVFSKCLFGCAYYNIPEYQRGYKWTANNVKQLLDDLKNFKKSNNKEDFYCLQNITVAESNVNGDKVLNIIDGQQRLTTLFILLSYINRNKEIINVPTSLLKYSIRKKTDCFLYEYIYTGKIWDEPIIPESMPYKDQYYIAQVCIGIDEWFKNNTLDYLVILDSLKLIVNKVESNEEEQVFANINGGKVDLDGADLIRAILITRAAKQKFAKETVKQKIGNFRIELGIELDSINQWWAQKDVIAFFEQLLPNRISQNRNFNYKEYPIDLLYFAFYEAYRNKLNASQQRDIDIRVFENGLDLDGKPGNDHYEFYLTVIEFHKTMVDWFEEDEIFNLLGYLMSNFKSGQLTFGILWSWWIDSHTKKEFIHKIKYEIKKQLTTAFSDSQDNGFEELLNSIKKIDSDWYNDNLTKKILPLADILPLEFKGKIHIRRVSNQDFKCSSEEDKEHLRSQTRNLDGLDLTEQDKEKLKEENKHGLNSIGNIVLLDQKVNRSYGNSKLYLKIDRILSEFALKENAHIRPYTFDVFRSKLSNMNSDGELFWTDEDIMQTADKLSSRINQYINEE